MEKMNLVALQDYMYENSLKIFTPLDLRQHFKSSEKTTWNYLCYQVKKGNVIQLKRGFYTLKNTFVNPSEIANRIYRPSYISFESALSTHGMIPETVYSETSATSCATREFYVRNILFEYHHIKKSAYTGYILHKSELGEILIATPEKALADYLYFMYLGKKSWNDRFDMRNVNFEILKKYLDLFYQDKNKDKFFKFIKKYIPDIF